MYSKNKQSQLAGFRILLAIPTAFALLLMFSFTSLEKTPSLLRNDLLKPTMQAVLSSLDNLQTPQQKPKDKKTIKDPLSEIIDFGFKENEDDTLLVVEQNPEFKGGKTAMLKYLSEKMHFPELAYQSGIQGTVFVQFVVGKTGKISNVKLLRGIGSGCDEEAVRLVKEMPDWIPGKLKGKDVSVLYHVAIKFQLTRSFSADNEFPSLVSIDKNPEFKGGRLVMLNYIKENLKYPELAKKSVIQGPVFIQFVISKTGKISDVKILRGIGSGCDEEALRLVKAMPDWIPGRNNGEAVSVVHRIDILFSLWQPRLHKEPVVRKAESQIL